MKRNSVVLLLGSVWLLLYLISWLPGVPVLLLVSERVVFFIILIAVIIDVVRRRSELWSFVKKTRQSTWSPFQSPEVREICAHLTPAEHAQLIADARQRGTDIGRWIAIPFGVTAGLLFWWWQVGLVLLALFIIYIAISGFPRIRAMRRRSMTLLCEMEWARSRGYTPEHLKLMTFPWSTSSSAK